MGIGKQRGQSRARRASVRRAVLQAVCIVVFLVAALWLGEIAEESAVVRTVVSQFGYLGIFLASTASGFNLAVPVPVVAFLPLFLGAGFAFWPTLVVMSLGMTLGDSIGFFIGSFGRRVAETGRQNSAGGFLAWFEKVRKKFPRGAYVLLFLYAAFVPLPNEIVVIPMSFAKYRFHFMIPVVLLGNFLFNTLVALGIMGVVQFV